MEIKPHACPVNIPIVSNKYALQHLAMHLMVLQADVKLQDVQTFDGTVLNSEVVVVLESLLKKHNREVECIDIEKKTTT
ncbi:hypothetical protein Ddye_032136 [Dipteronia dyeriana]|uniref:Uncharacterized protein n=1 Tax=Dipteronia dyeriana TaxID=168575 RepID=A0AAD9TJM0_9ROSI|nr:hypothetical protein Ddye_032136 [Dipteronia dyeriana]